MVTKLCESEEDKDSDDVADEFVDKAQAVGKLTTTKKFANRFIIGNCFGRISETRIPDNHFPSRISRFATKVDLSESNTAKDTQLYSPEIKAKILQD